MLKIKFYDTDEREALHIKLSETDFNELIEELDIVLDDETSKKPAN